MARDIFDDAEYERRVARTKERLREAARISENAMQAGLERSRTACPERGRRGDLRRLDHGHRGLRRRLQLRNPHTDCCNDVPPIARTGSAIGGN
ncbi:hypothetical protein RBH26_03130 [Natronolimnohabitans sp. A-GB9]|nr:hypothetical protein [Natronolimnohabitans sp. A-GB9]MDQ2049470.1 hypothetical protein [Natronolimnohabitans sp. A-GB9]